MPKVPVYDLEGQQVDEIELPAAVFDAPVNPGLMHRAVVMYLANQRTGTAATKTRAMVRGGGRKPWRQKGLGRARHGSIRSPIWRGGGVTFGPQPRDYRQKMPKKARRSALRSALTSKVREGSLLIVDGLSMEQPSTKGMARILHNLKAGRNPLIVTAEHDATVYRAARNLPGTAVMAARDLNTYAVLRHGALVMAREAVAAVEEVLAP